MYENRYESKDILLNFQQVDYCQVLLLEVF